MKYIKNYKIFEEIIDLPKNEYYYHGSVYSFDKPKDNEFFITKSLKFAKQYADDKSFGSGMDADLYIYKYELIKPINIFNPLNQEDIELFISHAPNDIKIYRNKKTKKEWLMSAQGKTVINGVLLADNIKYGDKFKFDKHNNNNPRTYIYISCDEDNVNCIKDDFDYEVTSEKGSCYHVFIKPIRKKYQSAMDIITYNISKRIEWYDGYGNKLRKECYEEYLHEYIKNDMLIKIPIKNYIEDGYNSYHAFEAINDELLNWFKNNYDGVLMKEKSDETIMLFKPNDVLHLVNKTRFR